MSNRIVHVAVRDLAPTPNEAELLVEVTAERLTPTTEVRGRLMGPRCAYAATVEVAYALRPFVRAPAGASPLARRVVVPEASPWEPESPFLYEGPVELWQDGRLADTATARHGVRTLALGPRGLQVNGRPLTLRGRAARAGDEGAAPVWRRDGVNLLLAEVGPEALPLWDAADRLGFFVIGGLPDGDGRRMELARDLAARPSCLGWLLRSPDLIALAPPGRVGLAPSEGISGPPAGVQFLVGPAALLALGLPLLVAGPPGGASPLAFGALLSG